jgi:hypothetical protein
MLSTHSTASAAQTSAKTILVFWMFVISSAKIMLFFGKMINFAPKYDY